MRTAETVRRHGDEKQPELACRRGHAAATVGGQDAPRSEEEIGLDDGTMPGMSGHLRLGRWSAAVAVLAVALPVVHFQLRDRRLSKRLVDGVIERSKDHPRPVAGEPTGTSFEACLVPVLDAAPDGGIFGYGAPRAAEDAVKAAMEGRPPPEDAGVDVWAELDATLPWIDRVLACTRAPAIGEAPGLGPFVIYGPRDSALGRYESSAGKCVALSALRGLRGEDSEVALRRCGEVLALARDAALDRGLIGAMVGAAMARASVLSCARLLAAAPKDDALRFAASLRVVRAGTPTFADILATETLQMQLMGWGQNLTQVDFERLPVNAQGLARTVSTLDDSALPRLARYLSWGDFARRLEEMRKVATLPTRDAELDRLVAEQTVWERVADEASLGVSFSDFADRYDAVSSALDLMESVAHVRAGQEPLSTTHSVAFDGGVTLSMDSLASVSPRVVETVSVDVQPAP